MSSNILNKSCLFFCFLKECGKFAQQNRSSHLLYVCKEQAYRNLEILLQKNPKYELEFKYLLAKIGIENNIQIEKSKKYLKQVERAFKENKLFEKGDLEKLRKK